VSSAERAAADAKDLAERSDEFVEGYVRGLMLGKEVLDECLRAVTEGLDDPQEDHGRPRRS